MLSAAVRYSNASLIVSCQLQPSQLAEDVESSSSVHMRNRSDQVHVFVVTLALCCMQSQELIAAFQAIDLEPEEPVLRSSHRHDRRRHITRVLLLILQVVNSELAAKRQSSDTSRHAVSFVAQHSRMMQRVLREASVGSLNGWEPGEKEAELAALVLSLVTRLSFSQLSQQPGAPAGGPCLYYFCPFVLLLSRSTPFLTSQKLRRMSCTFLHDNNNNNNKDSFFNQQGQ